MTERYLKPTDSDAFVDFPEPLMHLHEPYKGKLPKGKIICAQCKGHGGWNLILNAYPRPAEQAHAIMSVQRLTISEYRHKYVHFQASCSNCGGWGYVDESQGDHVHDWDSSYKNVGNCLNVWKCKTCGEEMTVDSSD